MRIRHAKSYDGLAIYAGAEAGINSPTTEAVAGDEHAASLRDALWSEYEAMLRDTQTFKIDQIWDWLKNKKIDTGRTSVHRDRAALVAKERSIMLAGQKARSILAAISPSAEGDILSGARLMSGQILFNALSNLSADALSNMSTGQALKMIDTLSNLSKSQSDAELKKATAELKKAQTKELSEKFDREIKAAQRASKRGDNAITAAQVASIRQAVFG